MTTYRAGPKTPKWHPPEDQPDIPRGLIPMPYNEKYGRCPGVYVGEKITFTTLLLVNGASAAVTYHRAEVVQEDANGMVVNVPPDLVVTWEPAEKV